MDRIRIRGDNPRAARRRPPRFPATSAALSTTRDQRPTNLGELCAPAENPLQRPSEASKHLARPKLRRASRDAGALVPPECLVAPRRSLAPPAPAPGAWRAERDRYLQPARSHPCVT